MTLHSHVMSPRKHLGQAMTEFLVVATSLALALFYPYINGECVVTLLLRTLMRAMRARAFLVSVMT